MSLNFLVILARNVKVNIGFFSRRYRDNFYVLLALVFAIVIGVNATFSLYSGELDTKTLDLALKYRLSSPAPSDKIIILDIDEKSLEAMAKDYGRWPWAREVLAETLATLSEAGILGVAFNIMLSDPDIRNKASDDIFNEIAKDSSHAVFPMIRLNPENDKLSKVQLGMIKGATGTQNDLEKTVAILFPAFSGTHDKLGLVNLNVAEDGFIREYDLKATEGKVKLPSMVAKVIEQVSIPQAIKIDNPLSDKIILNWRNKRGDYERISFSDLFLSDASTKDKLFKHLYGKIIVFGVSAPGIANVKPTSYSISTDDNLILATAIDDVISNSDLKILSPLIQALFAISYISALCWGFYIRAEDSKIEKVFLASQTAFIAVTIISISYTSQLFDLTLAFLFGTAYFVLAKVYMTVEKNAHRGNEDFAKADANKDTVCHVLCIEYVSVPDKQIRVLLKELEKAVGINNVFYLDNVFSKDNLVGILSEKFDFLIVFDSRNAINISPNNDILDNSFFIQSAQTEVLQRRFFSQSFLLDEKQDNESINIRVASLICHLTQHALLDTKKYEAIKIG